MNNLKRNKTIRNMALKRTKAAIKKNYANEEFVLIQAINAYNEVSKSYNLFFERMNEWFGLYFPEIKFNAVTQLYTFFSALESKEKLDEEDFYKIINDKAKATAMYQKYLNTSGRKINNTEKEMIIMFLNFIKDTEKTAKSIGAYIKEASNRLMPNTTYLTDEIIAAELLDKAGSLEKLSIMPSSTIQVLGAEKALFKHIKYGAKPPKYGILFKVPAVNTENRDIRGKIARTYASKIAIALKADVISKKFIAEDLKKRINESIARIKQNGKSR